MNAEGELLEVYSLECNQNQKTQNDSYITCRTEHGEHRIKVSTFRQPEDEGCVSVVIETEHRLWKKALLRLKNPNTQTLFFFNTKKVPHHVSKHSPLLNAGGKVKVGKGFMFLTFYNQQGNVMFPRLILTHSAAEDFYSTKLQKALKREGVEVFHHNQLTPQR